MWPFKRKKKQDQSVPEEIQQYYNTERKERVGIAWLLAGGTLVLTVVLAIILFFGGRWLYRTVFDENGGPETAQQEQSEDQNQGEDQSADDNQNSPDQAGPSTQGQPSDSSTPTNGSAQTPSAPSSTTTQQTPSTGDSSLPQTGPSGQLH